MVNKVILIGNMGADPEVRVFEDGNKVARIRIATTERIFNPSTQERKDHTEWHSVTLSRANANFAEQYARKGSQVYVEGKIRSREWEDANKNRRMSFEIVADDFRLLGRRSDNPTFENTSPAAYPQQQAGGAYPSQQGGYKPQQYTQQQPQNASRTEEFVPMDEADDLPF